MAREDEADSKRGAGSDEVLTEAETRVLCEEEADTVLAEADDRTQLVPRESPPRRAAPPDGDLPAKSTRVIDRAAVPAPSRPAGGGPAPSAGAALGETRVVEQSDKTLPPPVGPVATASLRAAEDAPPAAPAAIGSDHGLSPGAILFGEYEIVNVLGVGGMGEVYRARHRRLDEYRAIKVMHADLSKKKGASEFFYREAKALLAVRHPAVVHCHDLLSDEEGRVYLIMEMIEGVPLSKRMSDGPLSPDDVAILGARVSHGLGAAHRKGVIHRDVSPDNIVLPNGRVEQAKIIDFGIAKILQEGEGTIVDGFKGKLSYASPEQLGFFQGRIDGRSDFYNLGLVLAAAALGHPMPMGTTVMEAVDARRSFTTLPDEIPVGLRSAIEPLLALDPDDRPRYVDRLFVVPGGAADETVEDAYSSASSQMPVKSPTTGLSKSKAGLFAGLGAAAALVVGAGLFLAAGDESTTGPADPVAADGAEVPGATIAESPQRAAAPEPAAALAPVEKEPVAIVGVPVEPKPRRMGAQDRIRIIGLLSNAKLALAENRLMMPADDNAYDRFRKVLALDPDNAKARSGLREVATRYVALADTAIDRGDAAQARALIERAREADPSAPGISGTEFRLPPEPPVR